MLAIPRSPDARARTMRVRFVLLALFSWSIAMLSCGCGGHASDTTAPTSAFQTDSPFAGGSASPNRRQAGGLSEYPLATGNRWDYILAARVEVFPPYGGPSASNEMGKWRAEVLGPTSVNGREYWSVQESDPEVGAGPVYLERVDADGLFEYDNPPTLSPVAAPASMADPLAVTRRALAAQQRSLAGSAHEAALARAATNVTEKLVRMRALIAGRALATTEPAVNEIVLLRFPVRAGGAWTVRTEPRFSRVVVGQDEMVLPVGRVRAWRVQGLSELFGAEDRAYFWYSRAGLVRMHLHVVVEATDEYGNPVGKAVGEFDQSLAQALLNGDPGPGK